MIQAQAFFNRRNQESCANKTTAKKVHTTLLNLHMLMLRPSLKISLLAVTGRTHSKYNLPKIFFGRYGDRIFYF